MSKSSSSKRPLDSAFATTGNSSSANGAPPTKKAAPKIAPMFLRPEDRPASHLAWIDPKGKGFRHAVWAKPKGSAKVAAFDLDGCVIKPESGAKFPKNAGDWKWWDQREKEPSKVLARIRQTHEDGYAIVFISNQAGPPNQQKQFMDKIPLIGAKLDVPFHLFAAFGWDEFRKPAPGMWNVYVEDYNEGIAVDYEQSFFVGDAAGRYGIGDHSDSDRKMALNVGLPFHTPEEFFKGQVVNKQWRFDGWDARSYNHDVSLFSPTSSPLVLRVEEFVTPTPEVVLFVGFPASGKTSLYKKYFAPAGYIHVNQDVLKSRAACLNLVRSSLASKSCCVVDNTNPSAETRAEYVRLVRSEFPGTRIRAFHFSASIDVAKHNSVHRALDRAAGREVLPLAAFSTYEKNFKKPVIEEGFHEVKTIAFRFDGSEEEKAKWARWYDIYRKSKK